jgi:hypothetical protein
MRGMRFVAAIALPLLMTLAIGSAFIRDAVWAQLPPPNPLVVPPAAPSPPTQLSPPVPPQGLPSLAVVPSPAAATSPSPSARVFNCSCFGQGSPTHWMGRVTAPSYFGARQTAVSACLTYNTNKAPEPPLLPLGPSRSSALSAQFASAAPVPAGSQTPGAATVEGQTLPGTLNFSTPQQLQMCSQCTCG